MNCPATRAAVPAAAAGRFATRATTSSRALLRPAAAVRPCRAAATRRHEEQQEQQRQASAAFATTAAWLLSETAAMADEGGYSVASYSVSLGLFVMTVPGLWSLIKRAPKAKTARRTYTVDGPGKEGALAMDDRARQVFAYFKKYNYSVVDTGEVITFEGVYGADKSQAASLVVYTFVSLLCCALVLTIVAPWGGQWWYGISLLSPLAGSYYLDRADRVEQMQVKMVTSDDDLETDIIFQGDPEEMDRMQKELGFVEKGKVYVKGLLEQS